MKIKEQTPQEIYYQKKLNRAKWWSDNWHKFIQYPIFGAAGGIVVVGLFIVLCSCIYKIGKWDDKRQHPEDYDTRTQEIRIYETPTYNLNNPSVIIYTNAAVAPGANQIEVKGWVR